MSCNGSYIALLFGKKQDHVKSEKLSFSVTLLFPQAICLLRFLRSFTILFDHPLLSLIAILTRIYAEASEQMSPVHAVLNWCVYLPFLCIFGLSPPLLDHDSSAMLCGFLRI